MSRTLIYRFNRVEHDVSSDHDSAFLSYSVHPVHSLRLYHWVPLGFDQVYVVGHGEINSNTITLCEL